MLSDTPEAALASFPKADTLSDTSEAARGSFPKADILSSTSEAPPFLYKSRFALFGNLVYHVMLCSVLKSSLRVEASRRPKHYLSPPRLRVEASRRPIHYPFTSESPLFFLSRSRFAPFGHLVDHAMLRSVFQVFALTCYQ